MCGRAIDFDARIPIQFRSLSLVISPARTSLAPIYSPYDTLPTSDATQPSPLSAMKFLALSAATIALSAIGVIAAPAADNVQYFTLTTETDYGCVYYASGTNTETATAPGVTSTIQDDSTKTVDVTTYVYPPQKTRRAEKVRLSLPVFDVSLGMKEVEADQCCSAMRRQLVSPWSARRRKP